jgi:hypothetical protein
MYAWDFTRNHAHSHNSTCWANMLHPVIIPQCATKHGGPQCRRGWWNISKLVPLHTSTMVLKVFWMDIEWGEHHCNHFLSQFHGPGGWWHRRGDTSKERLFSCWAWLMGSTATTIHFHSLWVLIVMHSQHNVWAILKLVFGEGRSSSFSHPFRHWN